MNAGRGQGSAGTSGGRFPDFGISVLNVVGSDSVQELLQTLGAWGVQVVRLETGPVGTDRELFDACVEQGLVGAPVHGWGELSGQLEARIGAQRASAVALVWTGAHHLLDGGLATLLTASWTLVDISRALISQGTAFATFVVGDGPNFPEFVPPSTSPTS